MAQAKLLALQQEVERERSVRKELALQCAAKTRQLWQQREKYEKTIQQSQDQLSVLRASLLITHGQRVHAARSASAGKHAASCKEQTTDGSDSTVHLSSSSRQSLVDSPTKQQQHGADQSCKGCNQPAVAVHTKATFNGISRHVAASKASSLSSPATMQQGNEQSCSTVSMTDKQPQQAVPAATVLAVAAKLQQLVEQLTRTDPSTAAELSLLQWQLTAACRTFIDIRRSSSDSGQHQQDVVGTHRPVATIHPQQVQQNVTSSQRAADDGLTQAGSISSNAVRSYLLGTAAAMPAGVSKHPLMMQQHCAGCSTAGAGDWVSTPQQQQFDIEPWRHPQQPLTDSVQYQQHNQLVGMQTPALPVSKHSANALGFVSDFPQQCPAGMLQAVVGIDGNVWWDGYSTAEPGSIEHFMSDLFAALVTVPYGGASSSAPTAAIPAAGILDVLPDPASIAMEAAKYLQRVVAAAGLPAVSSLMHSVHRVLRSVGPEL
eukprot:GHRR01010095.1.p1 GENE.GHRR01010095.1~~GHRR01010095.1.p1  ORF type:complete len:489 (+),score=195.64 GHRR01010095.1:183-1649(+)